MVRDYDALARYVADREAVPFVWNDNTCVHFVAGALEAQTGKSPLKGLRLTWTTEKGALRALQRLGGLEAAVGAVLTETPCASAQRGDAGMVEGEHGPFLVLIEGQTLAAPGEHGLRRYPRNRLRKAWSAAAA